MDTTYTTSITKIKGSERFQTDDTLVREIKLDIYVNSKKVAALMATPVDQKVLAVGYLVSENIISHINDIEKIELLHDGTQIEIVALANEENIEKLSSEGVVSSGCGRSTTTNISPKAIEAKVIKSDFSIQASLLTKEMGQFYTECPLYEETGCVHTAKLYIGKTNYFVGEDIAQHNTIDKAIGKALLARVDISKSFLMVSGRLSSEMVAKAVMYQIPIIASRTAATCLGVQIAEKFNLTLIGFVRGDRMNIYKNPHRIL
jgi:FdhD protein